jgi:hypothetical protein
MTQASGWRSVLAGLLVSALTTAEPVWDWLPHAVDDDRPAELHLAAPDGWTGPPGSRRADGQIIIPADPRSRVDIAVSGPQDRRLTVRMVAPGGGAGLSTDADGRLRLGEAAAVLAVPRREAEQDRRWSILRRVEGVRDLPCRILLDEPPPGPDGTPSLTRQIAAAQEIDPRGAGVLIALPGADRLAAWKHREYRQAIAWLCADLAARGATHIALLEPPAPRADERLAAPLAEQARDAARAFRARCIAADALAAAECWEVSPGLLGRTLNARGREVRSGLLRPLLVTAP